MSDAQQGQTPYLIFPSKLICVHLAIKPNSGPSHT